MIKNNVTAWSSIKRIAHRCGGRLAPENSLAGLRAAAEAGYRAVEFDVMLSAAGTPWLIHDETLKRTSFSNGVVGRMTDAELAVVDISRGFPPTFRGELLPRFSDAALLCTALGLLSNIEIKPFRGCESETGERVAQAAKRSPLSPEAILLSSFSLDALGAAQRTAPDLPRAILFESLPADWLKQVAEFKVQAIHCSAAQLDWAWLAEARERGLAVRCYTVNESAEAKRLIGLGVDAVFTDAVDGLMID